jgi:hypothetical protein
MQVLILSSPRREFVDVQTVDAQLADQDSIAGNKNSGSNNMPGFTNAQYAGRHFVYGFGDGNYLAALREFQYRYIDWRQP